MLSMPLRAEPCDSRDSNPFGAEAPYREVTVIFTTAAPAPRARTLKELGNGRSRRSPFDTRSPSREALATRDADPRGADSTARSNEGGIRTRIGHCCEVSEIFTTSERAAASTEQTRRCRPVQAWRLAGFEPVGDAAPHVGSRWGTDDFGGTPADTRSASHEALAARDAPACQPIPRHDRSEAGLNPLFHGSEVSKIFTTSV
jgi:hypothetical protein